MPTIEVDEATLANFGEMQRVWAIAGRIAGEPKARELMQQAVLIAAPDAAGPEARIREEVKAREAGLEKKLDEFMAAQAEEKRAREAETAKQRLEQDWLEGRGKARRAGYQGESLENLEKFMEDRGIADHEIAISHFERMNPPPPPSITGGSRWNFFEAPKDAPDMQKLLAQDYEGFLAEAIPAALRDVRSAG